MIANLSEEKKENLTGAPRVSATFPTSSDFSLIDSLTNSLNHNVIFV